MNSWAVSIGLAGYFAGVLLYVFLASVVLQRGRWPHFLPLLLLLTSLLLWYACHFLSLFFRQMDVTRIPTLISSTDLVGFSALAFMPALLFHSHWRHLSDNYSVSREERFRAHLCLAVLYSSLVFLPAAMRGLAVPGKASAIEKLAPLTVPFLCLLAFSYAATAWLCRKLARRARSQPERAVFSKLFVLFLSIPVFNFVVFLVPAARESAWADFLILAAFSSSLLPTLLVTYYVYRYGILQIVLHRGVALVLFALLFLGIYLFGIRRLVLYLKDQLSAPELLVEGLFVVALLLLLAPLTRWLDSYVQRLFSEELTLYRDLASRLNGIDVLAAEVPLLRGVLEETLKEALETPQVRIREDHEMAWPGSISIPLRSGEEHLGHLETVPSRGRFPRPNPEAMGIVANEVASLLHRARLLHEKLRAEQDLARKSHLAQLGTMAASVAHNVKNPLSSMKTLLQLLGEARNLTPQQCQDVEKIVAEIDRLSTTVSRLLHFSRLETEQRVESPARVDLTHVVACVSGIFEGDLASRRLRLETSFRPTHPCIVTDEVALNEILSNLLANAVEASRDGGRILISVQIDAGELTLAVEDDGVGLPTSLREAVFRPFFSTKSNGTGLGLAIVRRRVEQLGGVVLAESGESPPRTRFLVRFPVRQVTG